MSWLFKIALTIDLLTLLFGIYLIIEDLTRFAGYPKNGGSGLIVATLLFCGWLAGCYYLYAAGLRGIATILAWIPTIPVLLYAGFIGMFLVLKPDFK